MWSGCHWGAGMPPGGSVADLGSRWGRGAWGRDGGRAPRYGDGGGSSRGRGEGGRGESSRARAHRERTGSCARRAGCRAVGGRSRAAASHLIVHGWRPPRPRARVAPAAAAAQRRPTALIVCRAPPPPPLRAAHPPAALNRKPPPARAAQRPRAPSGRLGPGLANRHAAEPIGRPDSCARGGTSVLVGARQAAGRATKPSANRKQAP